MWNAWERREIREKKVSWKILKEKTAWETGVDGRIILKCVF
jgi:hypothetical protein